MVGAVGSAHASQPEGPRFNRGQNGAFFQFLSPLKTCTIGPDEKECVGECGAVDRNGPKHLVNQIKKNNMKNFDYFLIHSSLQSTLIALFPWEVFIKSIVNWNIVSLS